MATTDATPVPVKNQAFRVTFPLRDAAGDLVTGATTPDSEVSKDGGTFADCTNEATEIATASGIYYLDLTATEMNCDCVAIIVKSADIKTAAIVLYPQESGDIPVDVESINGNTNAAIRLALSAGQIIPFTVNTGVFTPTTTQFSCDDIGGSVETTAEHYNGRSVVWTSGALIGQVTDVTDYVYASSEGKFTVSVMTEAPGNNDTGILV